MPHIWPASKPLLFGGNDVRGAIYRRSLCIRPTKLGGSTPQGYEEHGQNERQGDEDDPQMLHDSSRDITGIRADIHARAINHVHANATSYQSQKDALASKAQPW